jgi:hypothetical protein
MLLLFVFALNSMVYSSCSLKVLKAIKFKVPFSVETDKFVNDEELRSKYVKAALIHIPLILLTGSTVAHADLDKVVDPTKVNLLLSYWRYFLAGGVCASFSHGVTVPIDVIKTKIQTSPDLNKNSMLSMTRQIIAKDGFSILFKGLGATIIGYAIQGSLKYGFYEVFKVIIRKFSENFDFHLDKVLLFMLAGALAEFIGSTFLCPFETARIRTVANPKFSNNMINCLNKIVINEGIGALFIGLPAILLKNVPYTVVSLSTFEFVTSTIYSYLFSLGSIIIIVIIILIIII